MFILENSITRKYWLPTQTYLYHYIRHNKWDWVGDQGVVKITCDRDGIAYAVCDIVDGRFMPIGWVWLTKKRTWIAYEVSQTYVLEEHRGNGYAVLLYETALNDGVMLASGPSHTSYSMGLWAKFVREDKFNIWAQDYKHLDLTSQVIEEDGVVEAISLELYHPPHTSQDVRLIAQRKS